MCLVSIVIWNSIWTAVVFCKYGYLTFYVNCCCVLYVWLFEVSCEALCGLLLCLKSVVTEVLYGLVLCFSLPLVPRLYHRQMWCWGHWCRSAEEQPGSWSAEGNFWWFCVKKCCCTYIHACMHTHLHAPHTHTHTHCTHTHIHTLQSLHTTDKGQCTFRTAQQWLMPVSEAAGSLHCRGFLHNLSLFAAAVLTLTSCFSHSSHVPIPFSCFWKLIKGSFLNLKASELNQLFEAQITTDKA